MGAPAAYKGAWGVFALFTIPIGGGIPAGVLLARASRIPWPVTSVLYLVSDVLLAFVFEPVMNLFIALGRRTQAFHRMAQAMRESLKRTTALYGNAGGPLTLILIAFGVDPMTGRAAARAAGHGFLSGWTLAITGDMMYFGVIMACTLWLRSILGDGTAATFFILAAMVAVPYAIKRWRERRAVQPMRA